MRVTKGKLKFSQRELWSLDTHLSTIIVGALEQFKSYPKHSVPPHLYRDANGDIQSTNGSVHSLESDKYSSEYCDEQWLWLLDKMQDGFRVFPSYFDIEPYNFYWDDLSNPEMFSEQVWEEHPIHGKVTTWRKTLKSEYTQMDVDDWWERSRKYDAEIKQKVKEGRELFLIHYNSLWD